MVEKEGVNFRMRYIIKHQNTMKNGKWDLNEVKISREDFNKLKESFDKGADYVVTYLKKELLK
jgi:hypothetical protein